VDSTTVFKYDFYNIDISNLKLDDDRRTYSMYQSKNFCQRVNEISHIGKYYKVNYENNFSYFLVSSLPELKRIDLVNYTDN